MSTTSILSYLLIFSLLTFISWNYFGFSIIGCILILIHFLKEYNSNNTFKTIFIFFIFSLLFNICSTFWLFTSEPIKSICVFLVNSLIQTVILVLLLFIGKKNNNFYVFFIWPFTEFILTKWDLAWPWLTLGNSLGNCWPFIQWYEIVGVYGGSLWIILISSVIYINITKHNLYIITILLVLPCVISLTNYNMPKESANNKQEFLVYSPNTSNSNIVQKNKDLILTLNNSKNLSSIVITPELHYSLSYNQINNEDFSFFTNQFFYKFPNRKLLIGLELENNRSTFNTVALFEKGKVYFKTKKKYVPITEFTHPFLEPIFGKSIYKKNIQDDSFLMQKHLETLPFVCYEILFSDYVAKNLINAKYIILLSSEDFMNDSYFGRKQYLNLIRLRAIENRRFLIKNSYRGKSCIISPDGRIQEEFVGKFTDTSIEIKTQNTLYQKMLSFFNF